MFIERIRILPFARPHFTISELGLPLSSDWLTYWHIDPVKDLKNLNTRKNVARSYTGEINAELATYIKAVDKCRNERYHLRRNKPTSQTSGRTAKRKQARRKRLGLTELVRSKQFPVGKFMRKNAPLQVGRAKRRKRRIAEPASSSIVATAASSSVSASASSAGLD